MAIDMAALERAAGGDPAAKVSVRKGWLKEVHRKLAAGAAAEAELARARRHDTIMDSFFGSLRGHPQHRSRS